jgi:hypothetical protein
MPTTIDEATFGKIFKAFQADQLTTQAKYWIFSDGIKTAPTVFVPGENTIVLDGGHVPSLVENLGDPHQG